MILGKGVYPLKEVMISVITVCFNAENEIDNTIRSILDQDYDCFEYIIKDGGSKDRTLEIANGYKEQFAGKNISFRIVSEKDSGIYDAMNISLTLAVGEWVVFINAGDELYSSSVLSDISKELSPEYNVVYGDVMLKENGYCKLLKSGSISDFKKTNPICHQAAFTRLSIAKQYKFDCDYKIAADFDMFLRIYSDNPNCFKCIREIVCFFLMGGLSSKRVYQREKEFDISRKSNKQDRVLLPALLITKISFIELIRKLLIRTMGEHFYSKKRGWRCT